MVACFLEGSGRIVRKAREEACTIILIPGLAVYRLLIRRLVRC